MFIAIEREVPEFQQSFESQSVHRPGEEQIPRKRSSEEMQLDKTNIPGNSLK